MRFALATLALPLPLVGLVGLVGCSASSGFDGVVPARSVVALTVPGAAAAPADSSASALHQALVGERATFYSATVNVTSDINNGLAGFLANLEHILTITPTEHSGTHSVWGPTSDALSPANYRLDVERTDPGEYAAAFGYGFSGKPKGTPDSAYGMVIAGENRVVDPAHATGKLYVDNDLARALDPTVTADHNYFVLYDSTGATRLVEIQFQQGGVDDAHYHYSEAADGSGTFQFSNLIDVNGDGTLETNAILSRWLPTGAGRADVVAEGGSLPAQKVFTECWSTTFARTFYAEDGVTIEGDPATCVY